MPSKKQSSTSRKGRPPNNSYFLDRNLGAFILPGKLRDVGLHITIHDDQYVQTERDPWIFYERGTLHQVVVTSDTAFMKSFPTMAAIALAKTTVIAFTNNNYSAHARAGAFIKALPQIEAELKLRKKRRKKKNFIATVGMEGTFNIKADTPLPYRKQCDPLDWDSYEKVCSTEGVIAFMPETAENKNR